MPLCLCASVFQKSPLDRATFGNTETQSSRRYISSAYSQTLPPPHLSIPFYPSPPSVPLCLCVSKKPPRPRNIWKHRDTEFTEIYLFGLRPNPSPAPPIHPLLSVPSLCASVPLCFKKAPVFPKPQGPDIRNATKRELLAESVIFATALIFPFPAVNPTGAVMTIGSNFDSFGPSSGCTSLQ